MIERYAREQASLSLRRLAFRLNRASRLRDAESIHDLRVAIRRFEQCLEIFHQFLLRGHRKKIRRRLRKIMQLSGEIRNRDIALALLKRAGASEQSLLSARLARERTNAQSKLLTALDRWGEGDLFHRWSSRLGL